MIAKKISLTAFAWLVVGIVAAQKISPSQNVVLVTLDGMRWQEIFSGADPVLSFDSTAGYSQGYVKDRYWAATAEERRKKLMPFLWTTLVQKGLLLGNREQGSFINCANTYCVSYPGYNEIITGFPDSTIVNNQKIPNPNQNVFEFINKQPGFAGKVAAFGSWGTFSSIFNETRCGFLVNDGFKNVPGKLTPMQEVHNKLQHQMPDLFHGGERLDVSTFNMGLEYMKANKPRLMFFGLGDTDEFAHNGKYDFYLDAAHKADAWLQQLWEYIEQTPEYAGKTTLLIATDHGRGSAVGGKWKQHNKTIAGSDEIWFAALGPGITEKGEIKNSQQYYQGQIAATIAQQLGFHFTANHPVMPALPIIINK